MTSPWPVHPWVAQHDRVRFALAPYPMDTPDDKARHLLRRGGDASYYGSRAGSLKGATMVALPSQPLGNIDPTFEQIALETGAQTFALPGISGREKLLICVANDVCRQHLGLAFWLHVQAALSHNVPLSDLLAVIRFIAPYAGYPASADALARLDAVGAELALDLRAAAIASPSPAMTATPPAQHAVGAEERTGDPWLATFIHSRTTRSWMLPGLSRRECAFLALTTDVAQQTFGPSFQRHVALALENGASPEEVRDVVRFLAECGIAKAAAAMRALDRVLSLD